MGVRVEDGRLSLRAPGDDLLCGRAARYELVTSDRRITPARFARARRMAAELPEPGAPGARQEIALPSGVRRYVAIRAVDEQGNVGRPVAVETS